MKLYYLSMKSAKNFIHVTQILLSTWSCEQSFVTHLDGWSWFKFNNLKPLLGTALKFIQPLGQRVQTKRLRILRASSSFWISDIGKTGGKIHPSSS